MRGEGFPGVNDAAEPASFDNVHQDVDVVRHDTPCEKPIPLAVKAQKRILNQPCHLRYGEIAPPQSPIEKSVESADLLIPGRASDPFGRFGRQAVR